MRHAAKNRWFSVQNHLFFIPFFTHKELCELPMKSAFRQNAEAQKFVQQKTTLAAAGQRLYNQTKNRKEGFQVNIKIIQRQCGGTEFLSQPHRLHLGAQNAAGVDELCFTLPEAWAGCTVALYLRRSDGTLLAPVSLDTQHCVTVDRRLTGSTGGQWMLSAESPDGKVSDIPLWEGGNATGTIELYRRIGGSLELIDRLQFENGLCAYQRS